MIVTIVCVTLLANLVLTYSVYRVLRGRLILMQDDISAIRIRTVPPNIGGRLPPSPADLQAARNRMDKLGVAHPGDPG